MSVDIEELARWLFDHESPMNFVGGPKYVNGDDIDKIIRHAVDYLNRDDGGHVQFEIASFVFKKHDGHIDLYVKVGEVD